MRSRRARYGPERWQTGTLWLPDGIRMPTPTVVLFHGGYWQSRYTRWLMTRLARSIVRRGWVAWNVEYRRVGPFGGGGWPLTLSDVGSAVDYLAVLDFVDTERVVTCGHSSGGQLARWAAARTAMSERVAGPSDLFEPKVHPKAAVSLAGVVDLVEAYRIGLGRGAVEGFIGGGPGTFADRYGSASPFEMLPMGVRQVLVHGLDDKAVPPGMSESYCRKAVELGDVAEYLPIGGTGHVDMLDPTGRAWLAVLGMLPELLGIL